MKAQIIRFLRLALAAAGLFLAPACSLEMAAPQTTSTPEELADFRQSMADHARKAGDYQRQTQQGSNLGDLTVGWFIHGILVELSSQDEQLYEYFTDGGRDMQTYLKTAFQTHPEKEIDNLQGMADEQNSTTILAARYALECLLHIPDGREPVANQVKDRQDLAQALGTLKELLEKLARPADEE